MPVAPSSNSIAASGITGTLAIANGGTGGATAGAAKTALSAASSGSNSDITALSALTSLTVGAAGTPATKINFGVATLNGGTPATVTVNLATVTANTAIFLSYGPKSATTLGVLEVSSRSNGVSFTITSFGSAVDISTVYWLAIEP